MNCKSTLLLLGYLLTGGIATAQQQQNNPVTGRFSTAGFYSIPGSPRKVYNFNPGWRFYKGDVKGAESPAFNDKNWEIVNVPHGLEVLGENASGMRNYQGPAWYRKTFVTPKGARATKQVIYFEAVMGKSVLWINGHKIADHFGGYLPFSADISAYLNPEGQFNVMALLADNSDDPSYPPGKPQDALDFTYLGGIYRDVYLVQTSPVHVTFTTQSKTIAGGGVYVAVKDVNGNNAQLDVKTEVTNEGSAAASVTLRSTLEDAAGNVVLREEKRFNLPAGATRELVQEMNPRNVHLWHPDDPYLHFIRTEVIQEGRVADSYRTRFGIRLFEMRGNEGFFVNKQFIGHKLSGVNRHQDYVYVGNALPNSGQWRDVQLLREGGVNIIRGAHYPMDPAFMDACDELGMLVAVATPGWQFFNTKDPLFEKRIGEDVRNMARRDRNYAATLLWETALNETDDQTISMMKEQHRITHEEMPYPGIFTVSDVDKAKLAGFDFYYHGGMEEEKCSFTREYGDGGEVENFYSQNAMTRVKREWGEQALLNQASVRAKGLNGIYGTPPKRIGAAIWCGIDHQRGYHPDPFWGGLLDVYRMPRYSYYLFKSQYDPGFRLKGISTGPMVYIAHELTQVSGSDVTIYSNCDEIRLTWLGKVIGTQRPDSSMYTMPHAPFVFRNVFRYHDISTHWRNKSDKVEMIAEGIINGKVVCREVKKYAERTTGIKLTVDSAGIGLSADGADLVPVRATITDNKGIPKVLASEEVHFEISGNGSLIGGTVNNINPMKTQFGTATILVRAGTQPGLITIKAYADGLKSDAITIRSAPSPLPLLYSESAPAQPVLPAASMKENLLTNTDLEKLKDENARLRQQMTSKEQEIMEMRSRIR
ncbi:sugar-binding domain-containing protein [Chitinophaga polysaccharea]|uniref:sugar-binding domain-containing protein n=1 Tax=Chitinophaga polysaccharea TaxID=1293035 RepID=UPI00115B84DF|nr:sugar-binding domain-containing protein [Chitinophaga polysaccharea]